MKQFQFEVFDLNKLEEQFGELTEYLNSHERSALLFHIYTGINDEEKILSLRDYLKEKYIGSHIVGCLSNGEIFEGHLTDPEMVVTAWVFETTRVKVKNYALPLDGEEETAKKIIKDSEADDLKGIELLLVKGTAYHYKLLLALEELDESVKIFGGASKGHSMDDEFGCSFSDEGSVIRDAVTVVFYYGSELNIDLQYSLGWQALGHELTVTGLKNKTLEKLDNITATEVYSHYLGIKMDENFFLNVIEFPLILKRDGITLLREPFNETAANGVRMVSDLFEGEKVRIAYADPENIVAETDKACQRTSDFAPEAIMIFSCAARKHFWSYFVNKEMEPFQKLAGCSGFFSGGEIIRIGRKVIEQNVCLVAVGIREGEKKNLPKEEVHVDKSMLHGQLSILRRLATFARATTEELERANEKLREYAIIDELTKVYNRRELERKLIETLYHAVQNETPASFIMLDIDFFKGINDRYGHDTGDIVLRKVAGILKSHAGSLRTPEGDAVVGRFGGEEFIIILPGKNISEAKEVAESIRMDIAEYEFPKKIRVTASLGVTSVNEEDRKRRDSMTISKRVDEALYTAKNDGRNCVRIK
ncbi:diguanylate cyclase [Lachnospiraceae bacterium C1.1]|nr:diguanylate cyclase [Lachnospiraceae bacterium C1.1]